MLRKKDGWAGCCPPFIRPALTPRVTDLRFCIKCDEIKSFDEFVKDERGRDGYRTYCKTCAREYAQAYRSANRQRVNAVVLAWAKRHPKKTAEMKKRSRAKIIEYGFTAARKATLKSLFGITPEQYMEFVREQGGLCPCCKITLPENLSKQHVDHEHVPDYFKLPLDIRAALVRGVTCGNCNRAMGLFGDDPERMRNAADYQEAYRERKRNAYRRNDAGVDVPCATHNLTVHVE